MFLFLFLDIIRNSSHYVRDFYPFKRNHTPKMRLKQLNKEQGLYLLQRNAMNLKFQEIGKVLFTNAVLNCTPSAQVIGAKNVVLQSCRLFCKIILILVDLREMNIFLPFSSRGIQLKEIRSTITFG